MKKLISVFLSLIMVLSLFAGISVSAFAACAHKRLETWDNGNGTHYVFCYDCNTEWTENCVMTVTDRQEPICGIDGYERKNCTGAQCGSPDAYSVTGGCGRSQLTTLASQGNDHVYVWQLVTEPTTEADGQAKLVCQNCGTEPENNTRVLPALTQENVGTDGYAYTVEVEPGCENPGTAVYSLVLTNSDSTQETFEFTAEIPATGNHTAAWCIYQEPSVEAPGRLAYMCSGCNTIEQIGDEMPVLTNTDYYTRTEHHPATCAEQGYDVYVSNPGVFDCCPEQQFTILIQTAETGHVFSLTDNGDGTHSGTCSVCGETVTEAHHYEEENDFVCECGAEEALCFDFTNTEADQIKYESGLYGGVNYDTLNWTRGGNNGTITNSGIGTLDCTTLNDGNTALSLVPSETGSMSNGFVLNYHPKAGDIAEVRVKIASLTAAIPTLSLRFFAEENDAVYADEAPVSFAGTAGRYAIVVIPLSEALNLDQISSFCLTIDAAASGSEIGTVNIDYIYIGAPSGAPSASAQGNAHTHAMDVSCSHTSGGLLSFEALDLTGGTLPAGDYFLSEDVTLTSTLTVASGTVNLCLNGHTLDCGSYHLDVTAGTLNICDCGSGSIIGIGHETTAPIIINGGTVNLYGGTVANTATAAASGINDCMYCAFNIASGTLNLKGGTVSSTIGDTIRNWDLLVMDGGDVIADGTGAAAISNSGTARLYGGTATGAKNMGVWNQGTLSVYDGMTISGDTGIVNKKSTTDGLLNIYGGTITATGDYGIYNMHSEACVNFMGAPILDAPIADIYMAASTAMNIFGEVTGGPYSVKVDGTPTAAAPITFVDNWLKFNSDTVVSDCFVSADAGNTVYCAANGNSLCLAPTSGHSHDMSASCGQIHPMNFSSALTYTAPTMYENIIAAGKAVADFVETNKKLPSTVNIGTTNVNMRQFLWLACKTIIGLNSGKTNENFTIPSVGTAPDPTESLTAGSLTKSNYVTMCSNTVSYIDTNGRVPNYCTISLGTIRYENLAYSTAAILRSYKQNSSLPSSFSVKKWSTITSGTAGSATTATVTTEKVLTAGNYYLTADVTLSGLLTISSGTVNLCLNGYTLNCGGYSIIVKDGTLNICDCGNGKIQSTASSGQAIQVNGGTVHLYSGTVQNTCTSATTANNARAIYVNDGTVLVDGGTIKSNIGTAITVGSGKLTVGGDAIINGGYHGINNSGTTTLNGGTVSNPGTVSAFYNIGSATVNNGATINAPLAISNGSSSTHAVLNINGGIINGTGNYGIMNNASSATINFKGAPVINSNEADFILKDSSTITPAGAVTGGPYTILTETAPTVSALVNVVSNYSTATSIAEISQHFEAASASYKIVRNGSWLKLALASGHIHDMSQDCACTGPMNCLASLPTSGTVSGGYYYLSADMTLTGNLTVAASVNICLNGKTLNCGSYHIEVADGGSLYICDCGTTGTITGTVGANNTTGYGVIRVNGGTDESAKGASLSVYGGTVVNTGTTSTAGTENQMRAINVMNGTATICGDCAITCNNGTAILVQQNASLSVQNTASISAASRAIHSAGTIKMTGGTVSSSSNGILVSGGKLDMSGGSVSGNTRGIALTGSGAETTITGGTVTGGTANTSCCYALENNSTAKVTVNGGTLTGVGTGSGGIYCRSTGTVEIVKGTVSGVRSGVYAGGEGTVNISGGTVSGGLAGVLNRINSMVNISGGTVSGTGDEGCGVMTTTEDATEDVSPMLTVFGGTISGTKYAVYAAVTNPGFTGAPVLNGGTADIYLDDGVTFNPFDMISTAGSDLPWSFETKTAPTPGNNIPLTTDLSAGINAEDYSDYIASANENYMVILKNGEAVLHVHNIIRVQAVEPTCLTPGLTAKETCEDCGLVLSPAEFVPAFGHDIIADEAVPATCLDSGLTAGEHCSRCDYAIAQEVIPALGHDGTYEEIVPAGCTQPGSGMYTCSSCGESYIDVIPALGHNPAQPVEENRVDGNCVTDGSYDTVIYCSRCGDEISRETVTIPAAGNHVPGEGTIENYIAPTCTNPGSYDAVVYCTVCSAEIYRVSVPAPATGEHTAATAVEENREEPTCIATGRYDSVIYCKDCGLELSRETIMLPITAHTPGTPVQEKLTEVTCTVPGSYDSVIYCVVCTAELSRETVTIPALGHQYGTPVNNGDGTHTATCNCGDSITQAHTYENGVCSCGAEQVTFGIVSASLRLDRNIDIIFTVAVPEDAQKIKLIVETKDGYVTLTDFEKNGSDLRFIYADLNPQQIGDLLTVTLSAKINGITKYDFLEDYSIRQYCVNLLNNPKYSEDAKLHTLLSDLLTYGATAQTYMNYKTNALVSDGLNLNPSTFAPISGKTVSFTGIADANTDWIGAGLVLSDSVTMRFSFCAASTDNLSVRVCINGREETFTAFESDGAGKYYIDFNGIEATEFDDTVSASFYRNGVKLGRTVNYSVNTYICSTQNSTDSNLQTLVRALYNYGASAKAYSAAE